MSGRILVAEDNRELQGVLTDLFKLMNYEVKVVGDGLHAVEAVETHTPDILLLDVNLPKLSGLDVLRHVRSQPHLQQIKTVLLTGNIRTVVQPEAKLADAVLIKPVDFHELMQTIHGLHRPSRTAAV